MSLPTPQYPGLDPNEDRGPAIIAVGIVSMVIAFAVTVLRFFSRAYTRVEFGIDDWLHAIALFFTWVFSLIVMENVHHYHYGQHVGKVSPQDFKNFNKLLYTSAIIYAPALAFSKLSLLALYWRIFNLTSGLRPTQIAIVLNIAWMIAATLVGLVPCVPVVGYWDTNVPSKCIDFIAFYTANQAFSILLDLVVVCMPVFYISQLWQSLSHRISIASTFLLGLVVTVVQGLRLWRLILAHGIPGPDPTFANVDAGLWGMVELNLWVVVAAIPAIRPLINKFFHDRRVARNRCLQPQRNQDPRLLAQQLNAKPNFFMNHLKTQSADSNNDASIELGMANGAISKHDLHMSASAEQKRGWSPFDEPMPVDKPMPFDEPSPFDEPKPGRDMDMNEFLRSTRPAA